MQNQVYGEIVAGDTGSPIVSTEDGEKVEPTVSFVSYYSLCAYEQENGSIIGMIVVLMRAKTREGELYWLLSETE